VKRVRLVGEAVFTGGWLGMQQVALGFALLAGAGATAALFFALIAAWVAGGAAGALFGRRPALLLGTGLGLAVIAELSLGTWPFAAAPIGLAMVAGAACGAYASVFLRDRASVWGDARGLLLWENNGFLGGYALGGLLLLFWSSDVLDVGSAILGLALLAQRLRWG